jgi:hypothetical protein
MTQFNTPISAIMTRLNANFTAIPVIGFNDDGEGEDLNGDFVVVKVMPDSSTVASINGPTNRIRTSGVIIFYIYTALNTGIQAGVDYADQIAAIFRQKSFDNVVCLSTRLAYQDKNEYNKKSLWLTQLVCGFFYDENFAIT